MTDYTTQINAYFDTEKQVLDQLSRDEINHLIAILENARLQHQKIYIFGNGGSATTATHYVNDFNKGVATPNGPHYQFECLNDNLAMLTAIANDISYDDVFSYQLQTKLKPGDVVIGISGSGNSANIVRALNYANQAGAVTIALCGYDGGQVKKIAQHHLHVNINNMQITEDIHLILSHLIMTILRAQNC